MPAASDAVRCARAYLVRVADMPAPALTAFVVRHGPVRAAELVAAGEVPAAVRDETAARRLVNRVEDDFADARRVGARLVCPEDDEWPTEPLAALSVHNGRELAVPVALWLRGPARLDEALAGAVGVVGARAATGYGEHMAAEVGYSLAAAGRTIVSGLSYGIDAAAHRGALAAEGVTVAVLGCGVDITYPTGNALLCDRIVEHGLLVSAYPPGTVAARHRLAERGGLLAALATATVVVEAGPHSGSRAVAATAAALGRPVMAVPGPVTSAMSTGCHELLRDGTAVLVTAATDILDALTSARRHHPPAPASAAGAA